MKTIKLREFQRYLHKIIKEGEDLQVIKPDGQILFSVLIATNGNYYTLNPNNGRCVEHKIKDGRASVSQNPVKLETIDTELTVTHGINDGRAWGSQIIEKQIKCDKCKISEAEYFGENYNDIGDWVTMKICEICYKKFKPRNFRKI